MSYVAKTLFNATSLNDSNIQFNAGEVVDESLFDSGYLEKLVEIGFLDKVTKKTKSSETKSESTSENESSEGESTQNESNGSEGTQEEDKVETENKDAKSTRRGNKQNK